MPTDPLDLQGSSCFLIQAGFGSDAWFLNWDASLNSGPLFIHLFIGLLLAAVKELAFSALSLKIH